jgi:hypothetical protein
LQSGNNDNDNPTDENNNIGFRVSHAPESQVANNLRPDLHGCNNPCSRAVLRDHPVILRARVRRAGKEEGPIMVSSREAKGASGPISFSGTAIAPHP